MISSNKNCTDNKNCTNNKHCDALLVDEARLVRGGQGGLRHAVGEYDGHAGNALPSHRRRHPLARHEK